MTGFLHGINDLNHRLTWWVPLNAETQISSDHVRFSASKTDPDAEWQELGSELSTIPRSLLLIIFDNAISLKRSLPL